MEKATGVPARGYSVTLPPFASGDPQIDNQAYHPDPAALGRLTVRFVVAAYDLDVPGLELVRQYGETRLYENRLVQPRAWRISPDLAAGDPGVTWVLWKPNRIELRVPDGGKLFLAEIAYPGWRAWVDGKEMPVEVVDGLFRGVTLPPGPHDIVFRFQPLPVYLGIILAAIGWLGALGSLLIPRIRWRR